MADHPSNVLLTGLPRSGTTLTCHLISSLPNAVAVHEPMDVTNWPAGAPAAELFTRIDQYLAESRESLLTKGTVISKQEGGKIPDNPFGEARLESGVRASVVSVGEVKFEKPLAPDFTLVVKHVAAFAAILKDLAQRYPCFAIVRNPVSVLSSWQSVDAPIQRGRIPAGERQDPQLTRDLDALPDVFSRQMRVLDWYFERFATCLPSSRVIRYEDVISSQGRALAEIIPGAAELAAPLQSRNKNKLYNNDRTRELATRLLDEKGAWTSFYTPADVEPFLASDT